MIFSALSFCVCGAVAVTATDVHVSVNDPNWYFSEYNWFQSTRSSMATANPGATFKLGWADSAAVTVVFNTSRFGGAALPTVKLAISVDDGPWAFALLSVVNNTNSTSNLAEIHINQFDTSRQQHELVLMLYASKQQRDRWLGGGSAEGSSYLEVAGAFLQQGGRTGQ